MTKVLLICPFQIVGSSRSTLRSNACAAKMSCCVEPKNDVSLLFYLCWKKWFAKKLFSQASERRLQLWIFVHLLQKQKRCSVKSLNVRAKVIVISRKCKRTHRSTKQFLGDHNVKNFKQIQKGGRYQKSDVFVVPKTNLGGVWVEKVILRLLMNFWFPFEDTCSVLQLQVTLCPDQDMIFYLAINTSVYIHCQAGLREQRYHLPLVSMYVSTNIRKSAESVRSKSINPSVLIAVLQPKEWITYKDQFLRFCTTIQIYAGFYSILTPKMQGRFLLTQNLRNYDQRLQSVRLSCQIRDWICRLLLLEILALPCNPHMHVHFKSTIQNFHSVIRAHDTNTAASAIQLGHDVQN